ncbi:aconitate hydratase [Shewanella sp. Choline-02u-19]|uniref:AMP-binding protein n=1 Tax=unclassified Shewanella TaxID=196818 RepID=UPI000C31E4E7|nr:MULTISPECIES: AMP-binding protein [unclassified Shewanella]PKG55520.1 aconitate hydratase [Shewanella sp. GutDb-MelDb]PKH60069.1 aconitate hydratase [Shewanella sp. Bg11-22]PKI29456.1 aconitate hydratase [Shewanella sp. Choline-02u-19]
MTELLKSWLSQGPTAQQLISFNHHNIVTGAVFSNQVAHLHQQLNRSQEKRWLLSCDSSDMFAVGLCAGLLAGKQIILPANTQTGTLSELTHEFEGVISDLPLCEGKAFLRLDKDINLPTSQWPQSIQWGELVLFTSGSSGKPKRIAKSIRQLDAEVSILEHTFAQHLPHCSVIATVSHQHIYGLLFKVLWPLAASRPFLSDLVEYPETLSYYANLFPNLCLVSSPAQLSRLPDALDNEPQLRAPSLVFSSGGPLSFEAAMAIKQCYGRLPTEVFGSTETGGIAYRQQHSPAEPWQTFAEMEIKQDAVDGALQLKSPYLENDHWLRCEDKVDIAADGKFSLQGRLDRIIKVEEKRLSLVQMESLLESHPYVTKAALLLLEQPRIQLGAAIELSQQGIEQLTTDGKLALNNVLKRHLLTQFERVTLPRRWRYPEQLPLDFQGKRVHNTMLALFDIDKFKSK